jgi:Protein of unknown function (DUF2000)
MVNGKKKIGVLIVNQAVTSAGVENNAALVLGLTAGRLMPDDTFGGDVVDGDGARHVYLTRTAHFVRKCSPSKLRTLRQQLVQHAEQHPELIVVDYTEAAGPSSYEAYEATLAAQKGEQVEYRAVYAFGPEDVLVPLTKNLSRL